MTNIAITKYGSEDSTAQTPGPPVQAPVAGQVTEHHFLTYHIYDKIYHYISYLILTSI